jgi:hypothetical protein
MMLKTCALSLTLGFAMTTAAVDAAPVDPKPAEKTEFPPKTEFPKKKRDAKWTHEVTVRHWNPGRVAFQNPHVNVGVYFKRLDDGSLNVYIHGNDSPGLGKDGTPTPGTEIVAADGSTFVVTKAVHYSDNGETRCWVTKKPDPPTK